PRGEDRVQKGEGVADQHPARAAHLPRVVGVVPGDAHLVADELRVLEAPPEERTALQGLDEELARAPGALLEVVRAAHCADAHRPGGRCNHPHPAVIEAVDADVAGVGARARLGAPEVSEDRRALMLRVLAPQVLLGGEEGIATARVDYVTR